MGAPIKRVNLKTNFCLLVKPWTPASTLYPFTGPVLRNCRHVPLRC